MAFNPAYHLGSVGVHFSFEYENPRGLSDVDVDIGFEQVYRDNWVLIRTEVSNCRAYLTDDIFAILKEIDGGRGIELNLKPFYDNGPGVGHLKYHSPLLRNGEVTEATKKSLRFYDIEDREQAEALVEAKVEDIVRIMDYFVGIPSTFIDRRKGVQDYRNMFPAGNFDFHNKELVYCVPSNFWLRNLPYFYVMTALFRNSVSYVINNHNLQLPDYSEVKKIINTCDHEKAYKLWRNELEPIISKVAVEDDLLDGDYKGIRKLKSIGWSKTKSPIQSWRYDELGLSVDHSYPLIDYLVWYNG